MSKFKITHTIDADEIIEAGTYSYILNGEWIQFTTTQGMNTEVKATIRASEVNRIDLV